MVVLPILWVGVRSLSSPANAIFVLLLEGCAVVMNRVDGAETENGNRYANNGDMLSDESNTCHGDHGNNQSRHDLAGTLPASDKEQNEYQVSVPVHCEHRELGE